MVVVAIGMTPATAPNGSPFGAPTGGGQFTTAGTPIALNLTFGPFSPGATLNPGVLGVNVRADASVTLSVLNSTPASYWLFPGGNLGEAYNYSANVVWTAGSSSATSATPVTSINQFVSDCTIAHCSAILQLPAEINSSSTDAYYVSYVENTLGFKPAYWEIGNEPAIWTHFGEGWSSWRTSDNTNSTPFQYAYALHKDVVAVHHVDGSAAVIGLGGTGQGSGNNSAWVKQVAILDGGIISAIGIHSYVAGSGPVTPTLQNFYSYLKSTYALPNLIPNTRAQITAACSNCTDSVFITELGSATNSSTYAAAGYLNSFSNAVFMAAEYTQALNFNLTLADYFAYVNSYPGSWQVSSSSPFSPNFYLFSDVLKLLGPTVYKTVVTGPQSGLYTVGTYASSTCTSTLMLVNSNSTVGYSTTLSGSGFPTTGNIHFYAWSNTSTQPINTGLSSVNKITLPPNTMSVYTKAGCGNGGQGASTAIWNTICTSASLVGNCFYNPVRATKVAGTWDPVDNYTVEFGGTTSGANALNTTYVWNNSAWLQYNITEPTPRSNATMVWDTADGYGVIFGGYTGSNYRNDTWTYVGGAWTNTIKDTGAGGCDSGPGKCPSMRAGYQMVYVPSVGGHGGYVLLFGGNAGGTKFYSDTWEYHAGAWTNVTSSVGTAPAGRSEAGITYDSVDNYVVMFGGLTKTGIVNDTWEFNPASGSVGQWSQLYANGSSSFHGGPSARMAPEMSMDSHDGMVVLTGGATGNYATVASEVVVGAKQTWIFYAGNWTNDTKIVNTNSALAGTQVPLPTYGGLFIDQPNYQYVLLQNGKTAQGVSNGTSQFGTLLQATLATNLGQIYLGQTLQLWANSTHGVAPYSYNWTLPAGCASANTATISCIPTVSGFVTVSVTVTDGTGAYDQTGPISIWVQINQTAAVTLTVSSAKPVQPPSTFWAFDWRCNPSNNSSCISFVKQTPVHWFREAGGIEGYNATSGIAYSRFGGTTAVNWNLSSIKSMCAQINPCYTNWVVPTQNNNTGLAVADLNYIIAGFAPYTPTYISLGNEPQGWVNFNHQFSATPLPQPYTRLGPQNAYQVGIVENRIATALQADDPSVGIISIESATCRGNTTGYGLFLTDSALYTHSLPNTPVIACHSYPAGFGPASPTVAGFLAQSNVQQTATLLMATKQANFETCGISCENMPLWVTELNGAENGTYSPYLAEWPDVAFFGAQVSQFIQDNISQMEYFEVACGHSSSGFGAFALLTASCGPTPVANEYTNIFDHFRMQKVSNVTVNGPVVGMYASLGTNSSGTSLLVTNTNVSVTSYLTLPAGFPMSHGVTVYSGSPNVGWQEINYTVGHVPAVFALPPEGVLLINSGVGSGGNSGAPPPAQNVRICGSGSSNLTVCWTNPPATTVTSTTIITYPGSYCINHTASLPIETLTVPGSLWYSNLPGLHVSINYCILVYLNNGSASSSGSNGASGTPGAPYGLFILSQTTNSVALGWGNPYGFSLLNDTVWYGPTCGRWTAGISTQGVATAFNVTGLGQGTKYCFAVQTWDGPSNLSATINDTTSGPPPTNFGNPTGNSGTGGTGNQGVVSSSNNFPGPTCSDIPFIGCSVNLGAGAVLIVIGIVLLAIGRRTEATGIVAIMGGLFVMVFL